MTENTITESLADIEALAHRVSWELMDETQRDEFMEKIVVPRWGKITSDGVLLKGTAWARIVGTTAGTIKSRYQRLCRSEAQDEGTSYIRQRRSDMRRARHAIRQNPELADEFLADPGIQEIIVDKIAADPDIAVKVDKKRDEKVPPKPHREPKPRDYDQMVDQGTNQISVALAAESSGKWTPTPLSAALLYFTGVQLSDREMPDDLPDGIKEIEEYANRDLR